MAPRRKAAENARLENALPGSSLPALVPEDRTARPSRTEVEGFGCPRSDWPHHIRVLIPEVRGGAVTVIENFGIGGHAKGAREELERCILPRARWTLIAEVARREFNDRLRARGLPTGAWRPGETKVERMLGKELVLLACACAAAEEQDIPAIRASWASLRPEERWWFAGWLGSHASERVMRGAALLLSGGPASGSSSPARRMPAPQEQQTDLQLDFPLFEPSPQRGES